MAVKNNMLVFRRVNFSDLRYYIKQLLFKSAEGKAARIPRGEGRSCVSPQSVSTTEGLRKDRKRKLDAVIIEDDTRPTVSNVFKHFTFEDFEWTHNWLLHIFCALCSRTYKSDNFY